MGKGKYHKNHINKVMMTAFTAFAFEDTLENGGDAIKLVDCAVTGSKDGTAKDPQCSL